MAWYSHTLFWPSLVIAGPPKYLSRYTRRAAISNHGPVALADDQVTLRWRDSTDHNRQKVLILSRGEFLRRFLLHLLPKGFVRIRHFGFLANRMRAALLPRCFAALHATPPKNESETSTTPTAHLLWRCPKCGGPMVVVERSQRRNSNFVLHRSWPRLHEITRPRTVLATLQSSRRASGFLLTGFFRTRRLTLSFSLEHSSPRRVRKSTSVTREESVPQQTLHVAWGAEDRFFVNGFRFLVVLSGKQIMAAVAVNLSVLASCDHLTLARIFFSQPP